MIEGDDMVNLRKLRGIRERVANLRKETEDSLKRLEIERKEREGVAAELRLVEIELYNMIEDNK